MTSSRLWTCLALVAVFALVSEARADGDTYRDLDERICPVLDMPFPAHEGLYGGFVPEASTTASGWGELAAIEFGAWVRLFNWENDWGGDLDTQIQWDTILLRMSETSDTFPLSMGRLYLQWSQRFDGGFGFELDASPGVYSALQSLDGEDLAVPFGGSLVYAFAPWVAIWGGASVYPTFKQKVDPRVGVRLAYRDRVIFDAAYPEPRLVLKPFSFLRLTAGGRASLWPEYNLGDDTRECLYYEELRAYGGLDIALGEYVEIGLQGGYVFNRKIRFRETAPDVDVDDAPFVRLGLHGHF